jgi:hypothetical protein
MGNLCKSRKGVLDEIKGTELRKGEHISVYKYRLMIMKWKNKKDMELSTTREATSCEATR